jgi:hypothetical protein
MIWLKDWPYSIHEFKTLLPQMHMQIKEKGHGLRRGRGGEVKAVLLLLYKMCEIPRISKSRLCGVDMKSAKFYPPSPPRLLT